MQDSAAPNRRQWVKFCRVSYEERAERSVSDPIPYPRVSVDAGEDWFSEALAPWWEAKDVCSALRRRPRSRGGSVTIESRPWMIPMNAEIKKEGRFPVPLLGSAPCHATPRRAAVREARACAAGITCRDSGMSDARAFSIGPIGRLRDQRTPHFRSSPRSSSAVGVKPRQRERDEGGVTVRRTRPCLRRDRWRRRRVNRPSEGVRQFRQPLAI